MRVLSVGNMYPPHHFGGYELVWESAVAHLRHVGKEVRVLTSDFDSGTAEPDGLDVHRELRSYFRAGAFRRHGIRGDLELTRHNHAVLQRHLDDFRPDVVTWWSMGGLSLTLLETVRRAGIPAVAFVHDEWLDYGRWADSWSRRFAGPRRRRLAPLGELTGVPASVNYATAAVYVFVSEHIRSHAMALDLDLRRTAIAHSGIHPDYLSPAEPRQWEWRLLYVGRLDRRKGVDTAVEALSQLPPAARLTIAGGWDAAEEQRLRALARGCDVHERVEFRGQCDRAALLRLYDEADVVVFPVRWQEPWGLVPLEAMAKGRPVVATGRGGSGEYLRDGENCLLFSAGEPAALADAVCRLAGAPELRAHLRESGLRDAERHTEPAFNAAVEAEVVAVGAPSLAVA